MELYEVRVATPFRVMTVPVTADNIEECRKLCKERFPDANFLRIKYVRKVTK